MPRHLLDSIFSFLIVLIALLLLALAIKILAERLIPPAAVEFHARLRFLAWQHCKRARGCTRHVANHTPGDENLLALSWEELPSEDKRFEIDSEETYRRLLRNKHPIVEE